MEGVQAIVQISRKSQVTGKIPLQVYDRSGGVDNVRFDGKSNYKLDLLLASCLCLDRLRRP